MNQVLDGVMAGPEMVDRRVYTSADIFMLEREQIFKRSWLFVAHASEFTNPGDYRATTLAGQPVVAVMGKDGQIRAFFNSCRHKGTMIVEDGTGNCDRLKCPYHHWTYDTAGCLLSVPRQEAYGTGFDRAAYSLVPVPRFEEHKGMLFANLSADAESLETFLGECIPYLDHVAEYDGQKLVSVGSYEYEYQGNWKLLMENTLDDYHAEYLHDYAFAQRADLFEMTGTSGFQETAGSRWSVELGIHGAYDQFDHERTLVIQRNRPRRVYVGVFPAFIALYHPVWDVTGLRVIKPIAIDRTVVTNYCLVPQGADAETRKAIAERFHYSWGPGGRAGVDDIWIFDRIQRGLNAESAGRLLINRGMHRPGPRGGPADDHAVRGFWAGWRRYMMDQPTPVSRSIPIKEIAHAD
ncbi:MAG TPA: aromatic ring-hydroxylating dioxygenase subunit alpha [Burkholderiales bacterium]|nr:aromatic ring-hydroxylating dioxygenase subunit alpha [Burkholderiales bacterium]